MIPLEEVADPVFSQKMMGDGYALVPESKKVYAPVEGTVTSIFATKHALGLLTKAGAEILIHMGLDTVELKGKPFQILVKEGEQVTPQTLLAEMDLDGVKAAGKATDIIVVMTNTEKMVHLDLATTGSVTASQALGEYIVQ